MPAIDWTLSLSNILTYLGVIVVLAWRIGLKIKHFETTLTNHSYTLKAHSALIDKQDERFNDTLDRVGHLAEQFQLLMGRSEVLLERRRHPRGEP
jgi:hypothetical protein